MFKPKHRTTSIEVLESRIAPATIVGGGTGTGSSGTSKTTTTTPFLPAQYSVLPDGTVQSNYVQATLGGPVEVHAGQVLTTGGYESGTYLAYVQQGDALFFFTDLNNNKQIDFNELTGISAGDGLRLYLFTDVHGDVVTNLSEQTTSFVGVGGAVKTNTVLSLSDSTHQASNPDGRVLMNSSIDLIELRQLTATDFATIDSNGITGAQEAALRQGPTTYSIFGNIYAGKGFGSPTGGLIIDSSGPDQDFGLFSKTLPQVGAIFTGSAASNQFFSFGASRGNTLSGTIIPFTAPPGQGGGDIVNIHAADTTTGSAMKFNIDGLYAGDGGVGANGGSIINVTLNGDDAGGYRIVAGHGGRGGVGGQGGSILNFSDLGSNTSLVQIQTGTGGTGTSGAGGNAGNFTFGTFNVIGDVNLHLGDGGTGFTAGGAGASLLKGTFTQPVLPTGSTGGNAAGTSHMASSLPAYASGSYQAIIGTHQAVDFNGDGTGDFVFTTTGSDGGQTSQLIALVSDQKTGDFTRYTLNGVRDASALAVADVNGDGHPDIIVASSDAGSQEGLVVFLSQYDIHGNFTGFSQGRYSPLPQLTGGDPEVIPLGIKPPAFFTGQSFFSSPTQISSIVVGDFLGTGHAEIALVATYYSLALSDGTTGKILSLSQPSQILMFMEPATAIDKSQPAASQLQYTGQFYADFGTERVSSGNGGSIAPSPLLPFTVLPSQGSGAAHTFVIEATALATNATHDVVLAGEIGYKTVQTYDYGAAVRASNNPVPQSIGTYNLGQVDIDRSTAPNHNVQQDFKLLDFTVVSLNPALGVADVAAIGGPTATNYTSPNTFLVFAAGDGTGSGTTAAASGGSGLGVENAGDVVPYTALVIKSTDTVPNLNTPPSFEGAGTPFQVAIMGDFPGGVRGVDTVVYQPGPDGAQHAGVQNSVTDAGATQPFDIYYTNSHDTSNVDFAFQGATTNAYYFSNGLLETTQNYGFNLTAGNGGNSLTGAGGTGGGLGSGSTIVKTTINGVTLQQYVGSLNFLFNEISLNLTSGSGGNGFTTGGSGGAISGVSVGNFSNTALGVPGDATSVIAGDGGRGVAGTGGSGGSISQMSVTGGSLFMAGNGGVGLYGGSGGSIIGNGTKTYYDVSNPTLTLQAGNGGNGTKGGGNGGNIVNWSAQLTDTVNDGLDAFYTAGSGGNAVAGAGGNGGSLINDSPQLNGGLTGTLHLQAGDGGNGKTGGSGGSVTTFVATFASGGGLSLAPSLIEVLAGEGGNGFAGAGGSGGSVTGVIVDSTGTGGGQNSMNKMVAGDGGSSAGGHGGSGGSVSSIKSNSTNGSFAVAGGAGGEGLTFGGAGGSVVLTQIGVGASTISKGLIVAGQGGNATAFLPNSNDQEQFQAQLSFGGQVGHGGAGGGINGFTQIGNQSSHFDLIAGNGGNTINYGTPFDTVSYVGSGGSIQNVLLAGTVGQMDSSVAIKSYNDITTGQTMGDFVRDFIRNGTQLDDSIGNVGIVVGAAGVDKSLPVDPQNQPGVYSAIPAPFGKNGSLVNLSARALMSAVAGSVDDIAAITVAQNIEITTSAIGSTKHNTSVDPGQEYLDATGAIINHPVIGGGMLDGALIAGLIVDGAGQPVPLGGQVFRLS